MRGATNKIMRFIVTAFHYNFPPSHQLSRVPTICCLDTPLCTRDQVLDEYSSRPAHLPSINWHIESNPPAAWSHGRAADTVALTALIATTALDH